MCTIVRRTPLFSSSLLLSEDFPRVSSEDSKQARRFNLLATLHPTKQVLATPYYFDHSQHIHTHSYSDNQK